MGWEIVHKHVPPCTCNDIKRALQAGLIKEKDIAKCTDCGQMWEGYFTASGPQWDPYPSYLAVRKYTEPQGRIQGR